MSPRAPQTRPGFRADIEGLRAVSVLAVLLWHAGLPWLPGGYAGVDVFFVISGFLMTTILLAEARSRTAPGELLLGFYARRARRLLPAAVVALMGTAALTIAALPPTRWAGIGADIAASAGYVINWRLAAGAVDYLSQQEPPSPVQHYWSLAVEEQFYLLWPLLIVGALVLVRWRRTLIGPAIGRLSLLVLVASLGVSVWLTQESAGQAYFVTHTRAWELALGSLVAVGAGRWRRLPPAPARYAGWVGLAMVAISLVVLDSGTPFPGTAALFPTVGAALILLAGPAAGSGGAVRLLGVRPMQFFGRISYSLYLWHWPLVVVAMQWLGTGHDVPLRWGLAAVALSVLPAWLSYRYVEQPVRRRGRGGVVPASHSLHLGLRATVAGALSGLLVMVAAPPVPPDSDPTWTVPLAVQQAGDPFGAMLLGAQPLRSAAGRVVDDPDAIDPDPRVLAQDRPAYLPQGCHQELLETEVGQCAAGDPQGKTVIAVVGDSHAAQWITALDTLGQARGWRVVSMSKSSCPPALDVEVSRAGQSGPYWQCREWAEALPAALDELAPDLVLLSSAQYGVGEEELARGLGSMADELSAHDIPVALLRDTPRPDTDMAACLQQHPSVLSTCAFARSDAIADSGTGQDLLARTRPELNVIDLTDAICPQAQCAPVVGGVAVYRDSNHLSATYVRSLAPRLEQELSRLLKGAVAAGR